MACDLYYFYESDLDKTNIKEFYDNLPRHLQIKFRASLHGIQIAKGNVLQGYRGPSNMCNGGSGDSQELQPSQGLQEIKFWWGARKDMNFVPVIGTGLFLLERGWQSLTDELEWSSLFFDSETGECLGHDRREAVEKLKSRTRKAESKPQAKSFNHDRGNANENREEYYFNMMTAQEETHAENLNLQGDQLFDQGEYIDARDKYEEAFNASKYDQRMKYKRNIYKAQKEINAKKRYYEGNRLFQMGRFRQAEEEYNAACFISNEYYERRIYRDSERKAHIEGCALPFVHEGDNLFNQGRFEEAISRYEQAIDISQVHGIIQRYRANIDQALREIDAKNSNSEGDNLFNQARYCEAQDKYEKAYNLSKVREGKYKANVERARVEYAAQMLNFDGVHLFNQGKFDEAVGMYQLACNKSQVGAQIEKYKANIAKAQVEIDALKLNAQGDSFFNVGRYNDALNMYLKAYDKSQNTKQKNVYLSNKNNAQDVISKSNRLDTLWKQAWDVENDTKVDRSAEAKDLFQKILSESAENLKMFPGNTKFEQFKTLAVLKIEGNELFNEGVNSQGNGMALLEEAQVLNQQKKYQLANLKLKEAKQYFEEALGKFEKGSESDQRFAACIGFVQDLISEVMDSIEITEQCMFSERLDKLEITSDNQSGARSCETDVTGKHNNYFQNI